MCRPYGRTPPSRKMWPKTRICAAEEEQIGYVLHKVGEGETMQQNEGCRTTKGATGSTSAGGKMAGDIGIDAKNITNNEGCRRKKGAQAQTLDMYLKSH